MDGIVKFGDFLNEYATKLHVFLPLVVGVAISLPVFSIFYNRLMDKLDENSEEHTSIWVAIGVAVVIGAGALFSWKMAVFMLSLFALAGFPMIFGDFRREDKRKANARNPKRLPYKANAILDEIRMATTEARTVLGKSIKEEREPTDKEIVRIERELNTTLLRLAELDVLQGRTK